MEKQEKGLVEALEGLHVCRPGWVGTAIGLWASQRGVLAELFRETVDAQTHGGDAGKQVKDLKARGMLVDSPILVLSLS